MESDVLLLSQHVSLYVIKCTEITKRRMATKRVCFVVVPVNSFSVMLVVNVSWTVYQY